MPPECSWLVNGQHAQHSTDPDIIIKYHERNLSLLWRAVHLVANNSHHYVSVAAGLELFYPILCFFERGLLLLKTKT